MRVLYFDPILGVSGDMILAALIDLGVDKDYLKQKMKFVGNFDITISHINCSGISARHLDFKFKTKISEDRFIPLIEKSRLSERIKKTAIKIIKSIFEAEKVVHPTKHVHLHELADADTLLDIVGSMIAIDNLKIDKIYSRAVKAGTGFIKTEEGNMPAFNFATAYLLKNFPVEFMPINEELTTPTGAAIIGTIAEPKDSLVFKKIEGIGLGAGTKEFKNYPNLLRVFIGEIKDELTDECLVIETNIDDMHPQDYDILFERLYKAGALEVFLTPVIMKQSRPGILLTVLCDSYNQKVLDTLFEETTSLGIRMYSTKRLRLHRSIIKIPSPYGKISIKISEYKGKHRFSLEYRDIKKIAIKKGIPLRDLRAELIKLVEEKVK